ncbi:MAG TPA: hypothetical protein VJ717_04575 [Gemmatimonadaceae bacterium]|nr:hypothetical protein [Gemmatimonadaceae bacterium]
MAALFSNWRGEWRLRRQAAAYVSVLRQEPADDDVAWLAGVATEGDVDRARWELRYARTALGLLTAERDALDDRTPSLVAREIAAALHADPRVAAQMVKVAEQQFNERLSTYRHALTDRRATLAVTERLGDALLRVAGAVPNAETRTRASAIVSRGLDEANAALREQFGAAALPPDVRPSLLGTKPS